MKTKLLASIEIINPASKAVASEGDTQPDLLYMRSVLVSTGQNKNDDVFMPSEMWSARNTPPLKPVNWEHQSGSEILSEDPKRVVEGNQIIGCIYDCFVADKDGNRIDEKALADDSIPHSFDIVIDSAIYKYLFPNTAQKIVSSASEDKMFVSMEAWFTAYDYLVGEKIVARNEDTSFLDNHLRAGGGDGFFSGQKVGRILRNIVFGGVGIVGKPANEDSVIQSFTNANEKVEEPDNAREIISEHVLGNFKDSCNIVINTEVDRAMANDDVKTSAAPEVSQGSVSNADYITAVNQLAKAQLDVESKNKELEAAETKAQTLNDKIDNLKSAFTKGSEGLKNVLGEEAVAKLVSSEPAKFFDVLTNIVSERLDSLAKISDELSETKSKLDEIERERRSEKRLAKIQSELGLASDESDDKERAAAKVAQSDKLSKSTQSLSDEDFEAHVQSLKEILEISAAKKSFEDFKKKKKDDKEEKPAKGSASEQHDAELDVLRSVTATETVPAGDSNDEGFNWNQAMAGLVEELFGKREDN